MKVLLIEPLASSRFSADQSNIFNHVRRSVRMPPLGVGYIAGALHADGHEVKVLDLNVDTPGQQTFLQTVADFQPKMVGVSSNFTVNATRANALMKALSMAFPEVVVITGGEHVTFCPEEALRSGADYVTMFEADITVRELAAKVARGESAAEVHGVASLKNDALYLSPKRPAPTDLDALPLPMIEALNPAAYMGAGYTLISGRGCNYSCYYCASPGFAKGGRARSIDNVMVEINRAIELGFTKIGIADDNLVYDRERFMDLCSRMEKVGVDWEFNAYASEVDHEMVLAAKAAHCGGFRIGVESGAPEILAKIKRGSSVEQFIRLVKWTTDAGMLPACGFMFPHYCDTHETLAETKALMKELSDLGASVNATLSTPFPGSRMYRHPEFFGLNIVSRNWDDYDLRTPTFTTPHFGLQEIAAIFEDLENMYFESATDVAKATISEMGYDASLVDGIDFASLVRSLTARG